MKKWFFLIPILISTVITAKSNNTFLIPGKSEIIFLEKTEAASFLKTKDEFITLLSPFDRAARLKTNQYVSTEDFLNQISLAALDWNSFELNKIERIILSIRNKIRHLNLNLPDKIYLIKTTGNEEGKAAYCRRNAIILPQNYVDKDAILLENDIIHELFHIYSKNNLSQRDKLYNLIGFYKCPELIYPKELQEIKITNPDAYLNNYYINVISQSEQRKVIPILFAKGPYNASEGKEFFKYIQFFLLEVEISNDQCLPVYRNDSLSLMLPNQSYFEQIGYNTNYIINPEEILADNFVKLVNQDKNINSMFVIEGMKKILTE